MNVCHCKPMQWHTLKPSLVMYSSDGRKKRGWDRAQQFFSFFNFLVQWSFIFEATFGCHLFPAPCTLVDLPIHILHGWLFI